MNVNLPPSSNREMAEYLGKPLAMLLADHHLTFAGVIKLDEPPYYLSSIAFKVPESGGYLRAWLSPHPLLFSETAVWDAHAVPAQALVRRIALGLNALCIAPNAVYE